MIKSMTGYGNASLETETCSISAEIKALNSKFLELTVRLPRDFSDKEMEIRTLVGQVIERGKVNLFVERQVKGAVKPRVFVNRPVFEAYYKDLAAAAEAVDASKEELLKIALGMPDATTSESVALPNPNQSYQDWQSVYQVISETLANCNTFRAAEGKTLKGKLAEYIQRIGFLLDQVSAADPQRMINTRNRLRERIAEISSEENIDSNRFEQELIYYIEKLDIAEEKVRLKSHLDYFMEALENGNGKKLGFIAQEIGREINTIGSKVNEAAIQRMVVEMKEELEKIKEQSLNIL